MPATRAGPRVGEPAAGNEGRADMASQGLRNLGRSGLRVSPLCLGAMNFGNDQFGCDEKTSIGVIHAYLDAGHNFIDTANVYSGTKSETIVGKAVKDRRDAVVVATKASSPLGAGPFESGSSRKHVVKACEDSLRRLGTDYIDLYQMHRYDDLTPIEETLSTLNDLVRQGKVRYIGVSNWTASQIVEACPSSPPRARGTPGEVCRRSTASSRATSRSRSCRPAASSAWALSRGVRWPGAC